MAFLLFLFLLSLPTVIIVLLSKLNGDGKKPQSPPGPRGLPFIGNLHQIDNSVIHESLAKLSKKYGPLMSLRLGFKPAIVVSSETEAKEVLKTHDLIFSGRPVMLGQQKLSYNGLDIAFSQYNEYWREMRKISVLHLFSSKRVESFKPIQMDEVCRIIKKISQQARSSKLTDLSELVLELTSSMICRIAFGKRLEDVENGRSRRFHRLSREAEALLTGFFFSDYFPLVGWVDKLTGKISRLEMNFKEFDLFYQELIDEHLDSNRPKLVQPDIVDILLQMREEMSSSPFNFSVDHIKAVLMNIFLGGTATGAAVIIWAMTELIKNPRIMKRVQEEIRKKIGKRSVVDKDDIQGLPYFNAIIKETFRLHPPAPLLVRHESMQECNIRGYEIKPKTIVYINAWAIARDPESWENPNDFLPERFLNNNDVDFTGKHYKFIPFGAGRRRCPGMSLGLATVQIALANLLYSFDWELPSGMKKEDIDTQVLPGLIMHKKNALCLVAKNYV